MRLSLLISLALLHLFIESRPAFAISAITCHCFNDREYNSARPFDADAYFLATVQNTFFSILFDVEKKSVVLKKQRGISGDDLWIAYWLGRKSAKDPETLLKEKLNVNSWKEVVKRHRIGTEVFSQRLVKGLAEDSPADKLSGFVIDDIFRQYRIMSDSDEISLRKAGASNQAIIMTALLAAKSGRNPVKLYRDVSSGGQSWGYLLKQGGIDISNVRDELVSVFRLSSVK